MGWAKSIIEGIASLADDAAEALARQFADAPDTAANRRALRTAARQAAEPRSRRPQARDFAVPVERVRAASGSQTRSLTVNRQRPAQQNVTFAPPSQEPVVTQAARINAPVSGVEQLTAQHPERMGVYSGGYQPGVPEQEVTATYEVPVDLPEPETFDPQRMVGALNLLLYGDKSMANDVLTNINGIPVHVPLEGGATFGDWQRAYGRPAGWASDRSPVTGLRNRMREALEAGRDVYGFTTTMGPGSLNQTTMMTDTLLQQIPQLDISPAAREAMEARIRQSIPDFAGLGRGDILDAAAQLRNVTQGQRKAFVSALDNAGALSQGFPDAQSARIALTNPDLYYTPQGASGYRVVRFGPETLEHLDPELPHSSYPVQMWGEPVGALSQMIPFGMVVPEFIAGRRALGLPAGSDLRSIELSKPVEYGTSESADRISNYLDRLRVRQR
jgi:hypothetical protein